MRRQDVLTATLCTLLAATVPASVAAIDSQVSVARRGDVYLVDAVVVAPVSAREAWSVLTDFDAMATFVPNLELSQVTARNGERLRVEQRGVARWGPLAYRFTTVREIELQPIDEVRSWSIGGSLRHVESRTRFIPVAGGTEIRHHIEVGIDTWMPDILVEPLLRHDIREQFDAVVAEMLRRRGGRAQ